MTMPSPDIYSPRCNTCRFFLPSEEGDSRLGTCRLSPPIIKVGDHMPWLQPIVDGATQWCGHHERGEPR